MHAGTLESYKLPLETCALVAVENPRPEAAQEETNNNAHWYQKIL